MLKKISDIIPKRCMHREHNPPSHMVFDPGVYQHICPGCGSSSVFTVPEYFWHCA